MKTEYIDKTAIGISEEAKDSLKGYRNIALLGIDSRADDYGTGNRSDCIIIASINEKTKEVKLLSVYRDTYVYVTENGNKKLDKITHAYSYGGAQNTLKSLNEALDLNITEYVTVNFDAVIAAVNALNGVNRHNKRRIKIHKRLHRCNIAKLRNKIIASIKSRQTNSRRSTSSSIFKD